MTNVETEGDAGSILFVRQEDRKARRFIPVGHQLVRSTWVVDVDNNRVDKLLVMKLARLDTAADRAA